MDKYESLYFYSPEPEAETLYTSPDGLSGVRASNGALCLYDKDCAWYVDDTPINRSALIDVAQKFSKQD